MQPLTEEESPSGTQTLLSSSIVPQYDLGDFTAFGMIASPRGDLVATSSISFRSGFRCSTRDPDTGGQPGRSATWEDGCTPWLSAPTVRSCSHRLTMAAWRSSTPTRGWRQYADGRTGFGGGAAWLDSNRLVSSASGAVMEWDLRRTTVSRRQIGSRITVLQPPEKLS